MPPVSLGQVYMGSFDGDLNHDLSLAPHLLRPRLQTELKMRCVEQRFVERNELSI